MLYFEQRRADPLRNAHRLDGVARFRHQHDHRRVGCAHDITLRLTDPDRFVNDDIEPKGLQQVGRFERCGGQTTKSPARSHRPDEHPVIQRQILHPDPITKQRSASKRAAGIDGEDGDLLITAPTQQRQLLGQRALSRARRACDANTERAPQAGVGRVQQLLEPGLLVFDPSQRTGQRAAVAANESFEQPRHLGGPGCRGDHDKKLRRIYKWRYVLRSS